LKIKLNIFPLKIKDIFEFFVIFKKSFPPKIKEKHFSKNQTKFFFD